MKYNIIKFIAGALVIATVAGVAIFNSMSNIPVYESKAHTNIVNIVNE